MLKPEYFESIRQSAADDWELLEQRPNLAGPWWQLFRQVQSPRHVLSELLQNADDAGATEATVRIEGDLFYFSHNGSDFNNEQFKSLCQFGYSNKRALHTIGFRGIGFKSIFSLGEAVSLRTPTLDVTFNKNRFTVPIWKGHHGTRGLTQIEIHISSLERLTDLENSLKDWQKTPVSLLFFKNIRKLTIQEKKVEWTINGPGPIPNSKWVQLAGSEKKLLHIVSEELSFPDEAIQEIKEERSVVEKDEFTIGTCQLDLVLGETGRLFVVLPTEVRPDIPFAINAPFVQDPARNKIKELSQSATNRWLLKKAGELAASSLVHWIKREDLPVEDRAKAYDLLADDNKNISTLDEQCAKKVAETQKNKIINKDWVLTVEGKTVARKAAWSLPGAIFGIWQNDQLANLFLDKSQYLFSPVVTETNRRKLIRYDMIAETQADSILAVLSNKRLPKPDSDTSLNKLIHFVVTECRKNYFLANLETYYLIPVLGSNYLFRPAEVINPGPDFRLLTDRERDVLSEGIWTIDPVWFGTYKNAKNGSVQTNASQSAIFQSLDEYIIRLKLEQDHPLPVLFSKVAGCLANLVPFNQQKLIHLAQIAAHHGIQVDQNFQYVKRDGKPYVIGQNFIVINSPEISLIYSEEVIENHSLHPDYTQNFECCTSVEWNEWVGGPESRLDSFIPPKKTQYDVYGELNLKRDLSERGIIPSFIDSYKFSLFRIHDYDYDPVDWKRWGELEKSVPHVWFTLFEMIGQYFPPPSSNNWAYCQIYAVSQQYSTKPAVFEVVPPGWLAKLRQKPCIPDENGVYRKPDEVFLRNAKTNSLLGMERFVAKEIDTPERASLLKQLGVMDEPPGPEKLLKRLRDLSFTAPPMVAEIEKYYDRIDRYFHHADSDDQETIRKRFFEENLVFTTQKTWLKGGDVFQYPDPDVFPNAPVLFEQFNRLSLWTKIGIQERPTIDAALDWLDELPTGEVAPDEKIRLKALLTRYPSLVYTEIKCWFSLAGQWVPVSDLKYEIRATNQIPYSHLYGPTKQLTADFTFIRSEESERIPADGRQALSVVIQDQIQGKSVGRNRPLGLQWLADFAKLALRVHNLKPDVNRSLLVGLKNVTGSFRDQIQVIPMINHQQVGELRDVEFFVEQSVIYCKPTKPGRLAKIIPDELSKRINDSQLEKALHYCCNRQIADIEAYFTDNFDMNETELAEAVSVGEKQPVQTVGVEEADPQVPMVDLPESSTDEVEPEEPATTPVKPTNGQPPNAHKPSTPGVTEVPLMERYLVGKGYKKRTGELFEHQDGSLVRRSGDIIPWIKEKNRREIHRYLVIDESLELKPICLPAEAWNILQHGTLSHSLILRDSHKNPVEKTMHELLRLKDQGKLQVYVSEYRLALKNHVQ